MFLYANLLVVRRRGLYQRYSQKVVSWPSCQLQRKFANALQKMIAIEQHLCAKWGHLVNEQNETKRFWAARRIILLHAWTPNNLLCMIWKSLLTVNGIFENVMWLEPSIWKSNKIWHVPNNTSNPSIWKIYKEVDMHQKIQPSIRHTL